MEKRIPNWTFRSLNLVGHLILAKFVLQAILLYLYSVMETPKVISNKIKNLQRNFLWRGAKVQQKWALVAWGKICKPKQYGGLGLRDIELLEKALGAKNLWRWIANPNSPWGILWKAKYTPSLTQDKIINLNGNIKGSMI